MIVAGVMSGTSADGINVALVRVLGRGFRTRFELLAHSEFPYPASVRGAVLAAMNAKQVSVADLARLNFLLGELYAEAVLEASKRAKLAVDLVGCHGQAIYHQGERAPYLGSKISVTWQTGEGAVIAARCGVPVVSDFRPADMAAGGKGAPLVPFLDYLLYRHRRRGRIVQNIGGIANLTAIPARATPEQVVAFDTGPGNMVIDAVTEQLFGRRYDRDGRIAARGHALETIVSELLRMPFFRRKPPKTAGREEFGREFVVRFLRRCGRARHEDVIATATLLTARTIGEAVRQLRHAIGTESTNPTLRNTGVGWGTRATPTANGKRQTGNAAFREMIVSGGGANNRTLMGMLKAELKPWRIRVRTSDEFGLPSEAKEAVAFAVLAYQSWRRQPSNVPSATGADKPAILGKVSFPPGL